MQNATPGAIAILVLELIPAGIFGFAGERVGRVCASWPSTVRIVLPVLCALPYVLISWPRQMFSWEWCALYAALPVAIAWLLQQAANADPEQLGNWRDGLVLLTLGLAVDLRWFEWAWPNGLAGWGKLLLVDAGVIRIPRHSPTHRNRLRLSLPLEGLEDWPARIDFLRASCFSARTDAGISSSAHSCPPAVDDSNLDIHFHFRGGSRRALLPRLGAEPARTPRRKKSGASRYRDAVWTLPFQ